MKSEWRRKVRRYLDVSRKSREPVTVPCLRVPPEDLRCNEYQELVLSFRVTRALSLSSSDDLVCRFCSLIIEQIRNEIERERDTFRDLRERWLIKCTIWRRQAWNRDSANVRKEFMINVLFKILIIWIGWRLEIFIVLSE